MAHSGGCGGAVMAALHGRVLVVKIYYKIITSDTAEMLAQMVNSNLECGFILIGELVVQDGGFYQAMIYYGEDDGE